MNTDRIGGLAILIGLTLITINFIWIELTQMFVIAGLCFMLSGALTIYLKDLRDFQEIAQSDKIQNDKMAHMVYKNHAG